MLEAIANKILYYFFLLKTVTGIDSLDFTQRCVPLIFTIGSSFRALSTHFEPLYTNMYLIGPSDGTVSHHMLKLEIYGTTSVIPDSTSLVGALSKM